MTEPVIEKATTAEAQGGFSRTAQTAVMSAWVKNPDRKWWTFWRPRLIEGWGVVNFSVYHKGDVNVEIHSSSVSIQEMALARETAKPQSSEYVATGVSDD